MPAKPHSSIELSRGGSTMGHERAVERIRETSAEIRRAIAAAGGISQGLRTWAGENSAAVSPAAVEQLDDLAGFTSEGEEHRVVADAASGRVVKFTKDGRFGARGLETYLSSLARSNEVFGTGNVIEGVAEQADGNVSLVTSQPFVSGDPATVAEMDSWLAAKGYYRVTEGNYFNPDTGEAVFDVFPRNVLKDRDGTLHAIDVFFGAPTGTTAEIAEAIARKSPLYQNPG